MVLKIRLARWGARNNPFYGIVLAQQRAARDGKHLERLGTYNPIPSEDGVKHVELNCDRIKYWLSVGAQPTERAAWLLAKANLMPPTPKHLHNTGVVDLTKPTTWTMKVSDTQGREIVKLSSNQFTAEFAEKEPELLVKSGHTEKEVEVNRIPWDKVKLDGSEKPKRPLTQDEALIVLKSYIGL